MLKYFINPVEGRLRAGRRIIIFLIIAMAMSIGFNFIVKLLGGPPEDRGISIVVRGVFVIFMGTVAVWISRIYLDKKSFKSLGIKYDSLSIKDVLLGFFLSGTMIGTVFVILYLSGLLQVTELGWTGNELSPILGILLWFFGIGVAVGWSEELVFRGYLLQNLRDGIGLVWAVLIMCVFYGVVHMSNPNSTLLSGALIAIIGFLRIFGWLRSGQLWLSIGMHAGWNFFQGPVFGFQVSGMENDSLLRHNLIGSDWISGGPFGPEAGIVVIPVIILALIVMFLWTSKRENTPWIIELKKSTK